MFENGCHQKLRRYSDFIGNEIATKNREFQVPDVYKNSGEMEAKQHRVEGSNPFKSKTLIVKLAMQMVPYTPEGSPEPSLLNSSTSITDTENMIIPFMLMS